MEEEPLSPEEEYADALPYEQATATEANQQGVLPPAPALEPQPEAWGPVYYPEPEEGEGGAPPAVQIEHVEVVDPPPEQPERLPSFD